MLKVDVLTVKVTFNYNYSPLLTLWLFTCILPLGIFITASLFEVHVGIKTGATVLIRMEDM